MVAFGDLFMDSKGQPIVYKGNTIVLSDKFPVSNGDRLKICIESTNSDRPQGFSVDITGSCEVQGKLYKKGKGVKLVFWEDAQLIDPKNIEIKVFTKEGFVRIQNLWEMTNHMGRKSIDSGHNGAAMIVEEIEGGRRYRCNDGAPDEDFDDIVFTVRKEGCATKV